MIDIYSKDTLNRIFSLENFNSFQCSICYRDCGTFVIKALLTQVNLNVLSIGNIVQYGDFAGVIESVQLALDEKGLEMIMVSGSELNGLLQRRIIWDNTHFVGTSEMCLRTLVANNAGVYAPANRKIPFLANGTKYDLPHRTERNTEHETLFDMCQKVCAIADYGFRIRFDSISKGFYFEVYEGQDRSGNVVLGRNFDNMLTQDYVKTEHDNRSTVLIYSEKQDTGEDVYVTVGGDASGWNRREFFSNAAVTQTEGMTKAELIKAMEVEATDLLIDTSECLDVDVYNVNLSVGTKVAVKDKVWGIDYKTRVYEKQIAIQNGAITNTYILGNDIKY